MLALRNGATSVNVALFIVHREGFERINTRGRVDLCCYAFSSIPKYHINQPTYTTDISTILKATTTAWLHTPIFKATSSLRNQSTTAHQYAVKPWFAKEQQ